MPWSHNRIIASVFVAGFCLLHAVHAEDVESVGLVPGVDYAQVVLDGRELFHVRGVSIYKASMRADIISKRIKSLAADPTFTTNLISVVSTNGEEIIMAGDTMIVALVEKDAELIGLDRELAARLVKIKIEEAITRYRQERMPGEILSRAIRAVVITVLLLVVLSILRKVHRSISEFVQSRIVARLEKSVQIQSFEVVQRQHLWMVYRALMDIIRIGVAAVIIYLYLQHVLQLFPWTRGAGLTLLAMLVSPLHVLWSGLVGMIPDLIFLAILFLIVRYILRVIYLFFLNLEKGDVRLMGFESEWAQPTFRLVRFMIILLAIVVAYPYIPGSDSNAFKGISVFMGVVLSLGSSSLVSNIMAGYIMTYRKGFRVGDRIKIGDHLGDVLDIRMLVTRMRSPKNEEIIVPNTEILTKEVVNYSALANTRGLILHTTVGIGYETPWRQVEAMLLEAAGKTPGVLKDREPYVLQKALGDFAVTYEINVYCDDAQRSYLIYTDLHRNILDVFNQYGVQIMTPNYEGDPEQPKIVAADQWFAAPAKPSPDSKET